jgi:microcystin-dependent protein
MALNFPTAPAVDTIYAAEGSIWKWNGTVWSKASNFWAGMIAMWSGSLATIPAGWVLCNGANGTPNLLDKFIMGAGSTTAPASTGGAATITQVPNHTHPVSIATDAQGAHSHPLNLNVGNTGSGAGLMTANTAAAENPTGRGSITSVAAHAHTVSGNTNNPTGGVASIDNRPPYYALAYIMKTT